MRNFVAITLIACYVALGSGAVERWHNAQHVAQDAVAMSQAARSGLPVLPAPLHDDTNCAIHAQIHFSTSAVAWVPLLICLGLFVAFLTMLPRAIPVARHALAVSCRGPPVG